MLDADAGEGDFAKVAELFVEIFVITGNGNHGCVVGGEYAFGNECFDAAACAEVGNCLANARISRYATAYCHLFHACDVNGFAQFVKEYFDDGALQ